MAQPTPRRGAATLAVVLLVAVFASGCLGFYRAEVDRSVLTGGWEQVDSGEGERWLGLAAKWAHVTYEVDPPAERPFDNGPYAASLTVMSIDTPGRLGREEASEKLDAQLKENAAAQGIEINEATKKTGERDLKSGVRTLYFTYAARVGEGSGLFESGRDARVIGEVWFDERSKVTVLTVGLAQIQGGGASGQYFIERTNWARIVADPSGSIDDHVAENGLIFNTWSHKR